MINVIPRPRVAVEEEGFYELSKDVISISYDAILGNMRQCIACSLGMMSIELEEADICFIYTEKVKEEEYLLKVTEDGIRVYASDYSGAFYAMVTLKQLMDEENKVPCCKISDRPLYSWRGMQLDESRHFFGMQEVRKLIDYMATYKLNRFHWHLTDDQGWRIEIKKHPLLTEIGSKRKGSQLHSWRSLDMSHTPVEGYYTH
jgi:hexosaminidase